MEVHKVVNQCNRQSRMLRQQKVNDVVKADIRKSREAMRGELGGNCIHCTWSMILKKTVTRPPPCSSCTTDNSSWSFHSSQAFIPLLSRNGSFSMSYSHWEVEVLNVWAPILLQQIRSWLVRVCSVAMASVRLLAVEDGDGGVMITAEPSCMRRILLWVTPTTLFLKMWWIIRLEHICSRFVMWVPVAGGELERSCIDIDREIFGIDTASMNFTEGSLKNEMQNVTTLLEFDHFSKMGC